MINNKRIWMISWQQRYNKLYIFSCTNKADQVPFFFSLEKNVWTLISLWSTLQWEKRRRLENRRWVCCRDWFWHWSVLFFLEFIYGNYVGFWFKSEDVSQYELHSSFSISLCWRRVSAKTKSRTVPRYLM